MLPAIKPVPGRSGPDETGETVGSLHPGPGRHANIPIVATATRPHRSLVPR